MRTAIRLLRARRVVKSGARWPARTPAVLLCSIRMRTRETGFRLARSAAGAHPPAAELPSTAACRPAAVSTAGNRRARLGFSCTIASCSEPPLAPATRHDSPTRTVGYVPRKRAGGTVRMQACHGGHSGLKCMRPATGHAMVDISRGRTMPLSARILIARQGHCHQQRRERHNLLRSGCLTEALVAYPVWNSLRVCPLSTFVT